MKIKLSFVVMSLFTGLALLGTAGCSASADEEAGVAAETEEAVVGAACSSSSQCGRGEFCDISCSTFRPTAGKCAKVPQGCLADYKPVCGCDNKTYSNDCMRQMAKVGLKHQGACVTR